MLTFAHPWAWLLVPLPLLVWWLVPPIAENRPAVRVPFLRRLQAAGAGAGSASSKHGWLSYFVRGLIWLLLVAALARPQWLEPPIERQVPTRDMLLLVDLSGSMQRDDFRDAGGDSVSRLAAVKAVLGEFLERRQGDRVGLVVFGNAAFLQVPFTTDLALCRSLLDEIEVGMAGPKTALGDAIGLGIRLFENSDAPTKTMIALTDGNDTGSAVPPVEAARVAKDREITIHTVAIGDPTTVGEEKMDLESLRSVSKMTGGELFLGMDREELEGIYDRLDSIESHAEKLEYRRPRRDLFYWPLLMSLMVSMTSHVVAILRRRSLTKVADSTVRLRVNSQTFELETVDSESFEKEAVG